jgi:NAD-dependent deacetylase
LEIPLPLLDTLRAANYVVVLTGAGISVESGLSTFRTPQSGLWERFDAEDLATQAAFKANPALVWGWYEWRRMKALRAAPNEGHLAIRRLAQKVPQLTLITQNVDDLHERAGSDPVLHLHGSLHHPICNACRRPHSLPPGIPDEPEGGREIEPPRCGHCGGRIRPGVVWFGENLPQKEWTLAKRAALACDLFLSVGTSSIVEPAASLTQLAAQRRATTVQLNPNETHTQYSFSYDLRGPAGVVLPALLNQAG